MLMPKRVKYRKAQRGRMRGKATRGSNVDFGDFGLKALEPEETTREDIRADERTRQEKGARDKTDQPLRHHQGHMIQSPCGHVKRSSPTGAGDARPRWR